MTRILTFWMSLFLFSVAITGLSVADGATLQRLINTDSAQTETAPDLSPAAGDTDTATTTQADDDIIRLTPDRTKVLHLQENASSVVVTNPVHANITLDSPRTLLIMPKMPGATSFMVLDTKGQVMMEKNIVVSATQKKYVRIRKSCSQQDPNCEASAYYYCPDGCYQVTPTAHDPNATVPPPLSNTALPANMPDNGEEETTEEPQ